MNYHFEWDSAKEKNNQRKHGVSFEEAAHVFSDPLQMSIPDDEHDEERWVSLGHTQAQQLLLVVHTFMIHQHNKVTIRIVSARQATRHEQKQYKEAV
ncbi:MAG: BrnT family toxin [Mariprofundaceae bacterium]